MMSGGVGLRHMSFDTGLGGSRNVELQCGGATALSGGGDVEPQSEGAATVLGGSD